MKRNKKMQIVLWSSIALMISCVGIKISTTDHFGDSRVYQGEQLNLSIDTTKKLSIKQLNQTTNDLGQEVITFNYTVLPEQANNQLIDVTLEWVSSDVEESISDYLKYEVTLVNSIKLTCLKKANNQAKLTITSRSNTSVKASLLIDFNKDFLGFNKSEYTIVNVINDETDYVISVDDIQTAIANENKGFGAGTRYKHSQDMQNFIIQSNEENESYLNENTNIEENMDYLMFKGAVNTPQFMEKLATAPNSTFQQVFKNSEFENHLVTTTIQDRDFINDFTYLTFKSVIKVNFDYYGENYTYTFNLYNMLATAVINDYLVIPVSSITVEIPNIVF